MSAKVRRHVPITIGADPELFLKNVKTRQLVSAHDIFPGTKAKPFPVGGGAVQVDGVALELNINPSSDLPMFMDNLHKVTSVAGFILRKRNPELKIISTPTAEFTQAYFNELPAEVKQLGCSPDYNCFTQDVNPSPTTDRPFRTGAGHIHAGWTTNEDLDDPGFLSDCYDHMKQLAAALYIPSHAWDTDQTRRQLYGKIGACRPKHYGGEWRALSNAWLKDAALAAWVFDASKFALELFDNTRLYEEKEFKKFMEKDELVPSVPEICNYMDFLQEIGFDALPFTPETRTTVYAQ